MTAKSLKHKFASAVADGADPTLVRPSNWNDDHNFYLGINAQTNTSYTIADTDAWTLITYNNAAAVAVTLPQAGASAQFASGHVTFHRNLGAGAVTVTPTTSTINGNSSLVLLTGHHALIHSDGTNYFALIARPPADTDSALRNARMDIWQRGTSGTIAAGTPAYTADGWIVGSTGANVPWAQGATSTNRTGTRATYNLLVTGATSVTDTFLKQRIESFLAADLAGLTCTFQAWIKISGAGTVTPTITVKRPTGGSNPNDWSSTATDVNAQNLQACSDGVWTLISYTWLVNNSATNGLEITIDLGAALNAGTKTARLTETDLRASPIVVPPKFRSYPAEDLLCQRYLPGTNGAFLGSSIQSGWLNGQCISATVAIAVFPHRTPSRLKPTGITVNAAGDFMALGATAGSNTVTAMDINGSSKMGTQLNLTVASGLAAGNATQIYVTSSSAYLICTGAEL